MWDVRIPEGWGLKLLNSKDEEETYGIYDQNGKCIAQTRGYYMMNQSRCNAYDCRTKGESIDLTTHRLVKGWYEDQIEANQSKKVNY